MCTSIIEFMLILWITVGKWVPASESTTEYFIRGDEFAKFEIEVSGDTAV